ncbi:Ig-like domain-containing protein, partial [Candidatus Venteria ishoeyi]|uniref:Ig-like domain-containing protein n=1 Tax=Candidatus Venteria ishoeyi TaxID=1899563 RepID=UPI000CDEAC7D
MWLGTTGSEAKFETSISNTVEENVTITVTAPNLSAQTTVQFRNDSTNATVSSIRTTLAGNNSYANGKDAAILTVEALNSEGIAVTDADVAFKISSPDLTMNSETGTTTGGRFTSQLTSAQAGSYTVTPIVGGILYTNQVQTINFIAIGGEVSPVSSIEISADTLTQVADGSSSVNLTAIARNANNTPIKDVNIYLTSTSGTALLGTSTGTTGENGAFQTTLSNTQIESVTIGAFTDNFTNPGNTHLIKIEFTPAQDNPGAEPTDIRLDIENNNAQANGTDKIALHVVTFGENGIRLSGVTADFDIQEKANETPPLFVFDGSSSGKTNDNGVFTAYLTSTTPGTILITAKGNNTDDDEVKEVTFSEATTDRPAQLILLADSVELQSDNTAEGVVLTVQLKTGGNNPFPNQIVNFSASSGVIQPIPASDGDTAGESNATGLVKARLTTGGDPANRDIQVMAVVDGEAACTAADKDSHPLCDIVDIKVVGTQITIDGPENIGQDTNNVYTLTLSNANGQGIADKTLTVALKSGSSNSLDQTSVNTDSTGKATVILTVPPAQTDTTETLTVAGINVNASKSVNISTDDFAVTLDANTDANLISLGRPAIFTIDWPQGALGTVVISTTRGLVKKSGGDPNDPNACDTSQADWHSTQEVVLTPLGGGNFTVCSDNPGHAAITVNAVNGPSMEFALNFVAKNPDKISLQASPSTIGTNTPGSENESMEIIGIVRNAENSVVANATVSFTVHDSTGGYMSPPVAVTDQFGRVTSSYIAGGIPSPFEGVEITANVNNSSAQDTIKVTVGKRSVFISLGTGNELFEPTPTTYERPYTIFVNDANGAAVSDMDVNLSIIPLRYFKGFYRLSEDGWFAQYTAPASTDPVLDGSGCINEDSNNNGILDPGEDENNNGKLEPGNPFILPEAVRTDENGQATFNLSYTQEIANWVKVRLIAKSVVSGTENSAIVEVLPSGIASDFGVDTAPPGRRGTIQKSDYPPEFFPNQDGSIQV